MKVHRSDFVYQFSVCVCASESDFKRVLVNTPVCVCLLAAFEERTVCLSVQPNLTNSSATEEQWSDREVFDETCACGEGSPRPNSVISQKFRV